ncbi:Cdc6/Cdc18 family protein [Halalkalicoccus subterraneus]|uniref:Cdc6/Cdc18 family protein n=1 Tax=Halalkalicoccus subterraneus TaxID=2675002 RepID=UPI000EFD899B|nr:AAA family ATPase [Halalkalicoccus subterraneus]
MNKYDDLFEETAPDDSVFADKGALDPLAEPDEIMARDEQERELATILNGVSEGYLPPTVSIHGPPGAGKTLTARRIAEEFATRHEELAVEYVNLKECRTIFSAANEIHLELIGERKKSYEGLDGVFEGIWVALEGYPEYTVLILDEIDQLQHDTNYDPNEFFYRLLRGEGKLKRGISLSAWLISNQLVEVDLRLDSRVESTMGNEEVFFGPYGPNELAKILLPHLERAFTEESYVPEAVEHGILQAATRWGDARKALTLFRNAGELANQRELASVTIECINDSLEATEQDAIMEKLAQLPANHVGVLVAATSWTNKQTGEIVQPVTTEQIRKSMETETALDAPLGKRAIQNVVTDLETMGLLEAWIESRGQEGRVKQHKTTFDPQLGKEIIENHPDFI